jgi:hypothetical protein
MSFNDEHAMPPKVILDIETCPIDGVEAFIEPNDPPANYKSAEAIEKWRAEDMAKQAQRAALDPDLCRICALGWLTTAGVRTILATNEEYEHAALTAFWALYSRAHYVTFNGLAFDLPVMLARSRYLGVKAPRLDLGRYSKYPCGTDLALLLCDNGARKMRSLSFYLKRFGLPATEGQGSDVPALVAAGQWDQVETHLKADLEATAALAARLGVL